MNNKNLLKKDLIEIYRNNGFSYEEANAEIDFAIEIMCGISAKDMIMGIMPDPKDIEKLKKLVEIRTSTRQPIAQLLGYTFFMGQKFEVNENTLIPRPETELLVRKTVETVKENDFTQVLDIGTGCGCIACMTAKLTKAQVLGVDISNECLKISLNNAMHLDLMNKALFRKSDIYSKIRPEEKYDVIVSNPPYIPPQEREHLQTEVRFFEPATALFTKDDLGLEFYEKIVSKAPEYLNKNGFILFETGINQSEHVKKIFEKNNFKNIEIFKDVSGIERVIKAQLG